MTTAAAIAREDRLRYTGPERCSGDGQVRAAGDRYSTVIWLLGGNLLVRSAGFGYPFLAYHVAGRGHGAGAVGAVVAAYGLGWAVGQLLCGWLVDRVGARVTLVSTMLVAAAVLVLMAGLHTVPGLLVGAMIAGLVCDAPRPVLGAVIAAPILSTQPYRQPSSCARRCGSAVWSRAGWTPRCCTGSMASGVRSSRGWQAAVYLPMCAVGPSPAFELAPPCRKLAIGRHSRTSAWSCWPSRVWQRSRR